MTKEQIAREYASQIKKGQGTERRVALIHAALEAYDRSQWIPTSERLPEEAGWYLWLPTELKNYPPALIHWQPKDEEGAKYARLRYTHWRPLPTLPDSGEDED